MKTMYVVGVLGFVACLFAYFAQFERKATGLKISFFLIFLFLALRYEFGNDYQNYLDGFIEIATQAKIFFTGEHWQPGWRFLNFIFKPFGFFAMVGFLSLLNCVVYYRFIRKYAPPKFYWLAVFLYVFDPYLMLVHASMMRQSLAILFFLMAIDFLANRRIIGYFICALLAMSVHKSGLVMLPLFALGFINWRLNKAIAAGIIVSFVLLFVFGGVLYPYVNQLVGRVFPQYMETYGGGEGRTFSTGIGMVYTAFQLLVILYYAGHEFAPRGETVQADSQEDNGDWYPDEQPAAAWPENEYDVSQVRSRRMLYVLAILTFMFIPFGLMLGMFGRINYYFAPVLIVVFPMILATSRDKFLNTVIIVSIIPFKLLNFWVFFLSPIWQYHFSTYQTIFSAPQPF